MTAMHRRWNPGKSGGARNPVQSVTSPRQPGRYPAVGCLNPKGKVSPIWGTPADRRVPQHKERDSRNDLTDVERLGRERQVPPMPEGGIRMSPATRSRA